MRSRPGRATTVVVELFAAAGGFPGVGWLLHGRGDIGLPLAVLGPIVAWGVVPMLASPFGGKLGGGGRTLALYLALSAVVSPVLLALATRRGRERRPSVVSSRRGG